MTDDPLASIRRFGDPVLDQACIPCGGRDDLTPLAERMLRTIHAFRGRYGWGRAIAAPQIGEPLRLVALAMDGRETVLVDPAIEWSSPETHELWDDCMSLPEIAVRVRRHESVTVRYRTLDGAKAAFERADLSLSELLQHELDHLDGVLMTHRLLRGASIVAHENRDLAQRSPSQPQRPFP